MPIDFDALRGDGLPEPPEDGEHTALLTRAVVVETQNGERLVTEWTAIGEGHVAWESWNRFDTTGMSFTRDLLIGLGINLKSVNDLDILGMELDKVVNYQWRVSTSSSMGNRGDRVFVNTYVTGKAGPVEPDVPIDTDDLPDVSNPPPATAPAAAGAKFGDKAPF